MFVTQLTHLQTQYNKNKSKCLKTVCKTEGDARDNAMITIEDSGELLVLSKFAQL